MELKELYYFINRLMDIDNLILERKVLISNTQNHSVDATLQCKTRVFESIQVFQIDCKQDEIISILELSIKKLEEEQSQILENLKRHGINITKED